MSSQAVLDFIHARSRDHARTPMQWSARSQAGFTTGIPWIRVKPNLPKINVEQALADPNSILAYYRQLSALRKANLTIISGTDSLLREDHEALYAFMRTLESDRLLVILNFRAQVDEFVLPDHIGFDSTEWLIGNYRVDLSEGTHKVRLRPFETTVDRLR